MSNPSETKRNKILKAATNLFGKQGYGASMESIAKLADVSKQTVYSHFKNKDILFEVCMRDKCIEYQINKLIFEVEAPIDETLFHFAKGFQQTLLQPGAIHTYRNAVSQTDSHPKFAATYLEYGPEKTLEVVSNYLERKAKEGFIKFDDTPQDAAIQLLLMLHGKVVYWRYLGVDIGGSQEKRDKYLKSCIDMFLNYLLIK